VKNFRDDVFSLGSLFPVAAGKPLPYGHGSDLVCGRAVGVGIGISVFEMRRTKHNSSFVDGISIRPRE
jgi:hypothetical protein